MADYVREKNTGVLQFRVGTSETGNPLYKSQNLNNIVPESLNPSDYDKIRIISGKLMALRQNTADAIFVNQTDKVD